MMMMMMMMMMMIMMMMMMMVMSVAVDMLVSIRRRCHDLYDYDYNGIEFIMCM